MSPEQVLSKFQQRSWWTFVFVTWRSIFLDN